MDATTHFVVVAVVIANTGPSYNGYMGGIESICAGIRDFADCFWSDAAVSSLPEVHQSSASGVHIGPVWSNDRRTR